VVKVAELLGPDCETELMLAPDMEESVGEIVAEIELETDGGEVYCKELGSWTVVEPTTKSP